MNTAGAIADPRAYLQERVALPSHVVLIFLGIGMFVGLAANHELRPDTLFAADDLAQLVITMSFGATWLYARKGERSAKVIRSLEVALTMGAALVFSVGILYAPMPPGSESMFMWGFSSFIVLILMLRAAIVPSSALLTLAVVWTNQTEQNVELRSLVLRCN
jgi:hypothetical protein